MKQLAPLVLAAMISACTASDDALYPSLAPRPIEKIAAETPVSPAPSARPADAALSARLAAVQEVLSGAEAGLQQALTGAAGVSPDAERGSEQWVANQQAVSDLIRAQAEVRNIDDDIGAIAADVAEARVSGADTASLDQQIAALRQRVDALVARSREEIDKRR